MIHRHLDYPSDAEPDKLPRAALVDILDRGDLDDWAPLVRAVLRHPNGALARDLARLIDEFPMYGTSPLWRAFLQRHRLEVVEEAALSELRRRANLTQSELARRMGMSQSDLSKLERRTNLRLSTLQSYVKALNGELQLRVSIAAGEFLLRLS